MIGTEKVETAGAALGARGVSRAAGPFVVAHPAVGVLIDERPDGPAVGIFFLQVFGISVAKAVFAEDWILPGADVIAHGGEVEGALVLADNGLRADDHRRKDRHEAEEHDEQQRKHAKFAMAEAPPGFGVEIIKRIVNGPIVVDLERIQGLPEEKGTPEFLAIYEVREGKIINVWFPPEP